MNEAWSVDLIYLGAFCVGGLGFALGPFAVVHLLAARKTRQSANKTGQFIECGMEPIGDAWIRYSAVYYLYALVFVGFAVDVLYLIPVALVYNRKFAVRDLVELVIFVGILSLIIVYGLEERSFRMETQAECSQIVRFARLDELLALGRANSLWPLTFGLACCAIEMMAAGASRFDISRFGAEVFRPSPRQADVMIVAGTITRKMALAVKTLYDQMPEPKWVIAMGNCAISGGPFVYPGQYAVIEGVDKLFPVDVFIPGCPPRPEGLIEGILALEEKITGKRRWPKPPTS